MYLSCWQGYPTCESDVSVTFILRIIILMVASLQRGRDGIHGSRDATSGFVVRCQLKCEIKIVKDQLCGRASNQISVIYTRPVTYLLSPSPIRGGAQATRECSPCQQQRLLKRLSMMKK